VVGSWSAAAVVVVSCMSVVELVVPLLLVVSILLAELELILLL